MAVKKILVDLNLMKNEIQNAVIQNLTTAPQDPKAGQVYFDSGDAKVLKIYDGFKWSAVGELAIASADTLGGVKVASTNAQVLVNATTGVMSLADATTTLKGAVRLATEADITGADATVAVTAAQLKAVKDAIVGGVRFMGTFDASAGSYAALTDAFKGALYYVTKAGTISDVDWQVGDYLLVTDDLESGESYPSAADVTKIDNTESSDIVRLNSTQTLTNKTIVAYDNGGEAGAERVVNTISGLKTTNFKEGVVQTAVRDEESGESGASDDCLPTELAVRKAIDSAVSDIETDLNGKANKVTSGVQGHLASLGAGGDLADSGKSVTTTIAYDESGDPASDDKLPTEKAVADLITSVMSDVETDLSGKQDKVSGAVENNIATWDDAGNTKDSGKAFTNTVHLTDESGYDENAYIPTEAAVATAINNAISGRKLVADSTQMVPDQGVATWTITNTLATEEVQVKVYEVSTDNNVKHYEEVMVYVDVTASTITIKLNSSADAEHPIAAGTYHAVIEA